MAATLKEILLDESNRPTVVADMQQLIDDEVDSKSGMSGTAIKGGYGVVKKIKPGIIGEAVDSLLDDFTASLEPFYTDYRETGGGSLAEYFDGRSDEIADALLGVTDSRAQASRRETIKKVYDKLRPQGKNHVEAALPRLAELLTKHGAQ
ncbi:DUF6918 family protein [Haloechinothrix sp. LS1_15]|uniref:DUF6918 family protein n=1 Tax=Haloechinothrix sp. LS1_15 TaxID=2652248 RepID=UPI0029471035|nr:hypothetical protein [Haloechinothrix sp. LS1_15]MDV6010930.1 hypothetical protein [Haloechinothrix sp. LS1_15]